MIRYRNKHKEAKYSLINQKVDIKGNINSKKDVPSISVSVKSFSPRSCLYSQVPLPLSNARRNLGETAIRLGAGGGGVRSTTVLRGAGGVCDDPRSSPPPLPLIAVQDLILSPSPV
jgi:hypothetical protein